MPRRRRPVDHWYLHPPLTSSVWKGHIRTAFLLWLSIIHRKAELSMKPKRPMISSRPSKTSLSHSPLGPLEIPKSFARAGRAAISFARQYIRRAA